MHRRGRRSASRLWDAAIVLGVWLAGALIFFRQSWSSGFSRLAGNDGDTRLIAYVCEHWFQVLHGQASWRNPAFFYPVRGLLGWSDAFFLYQVFYAPLRELGAGPFLALQLTVVLLSLVGFVSFVAFVRLAFGTSRVVALFGAIIFTFANNLFLHSAQVQLSGIYLVPVALLLAVSAWRQWPITPTQGLVLAAAFGLLTGLLFFTSYYIAIFSAIAAVIALVVMALPRPRSALRWTAAAIRDHAWPLAAATIAFVVGLLPVLMTYLPARGQAGGSTYAQVLDYAANWRNLVDVGPGNLVWSGAVHRVFPHLVLSPNEVSFAVTPILMLAMIIGGAAATWRVWRQRAARPAVARVAGTLAITALVLCILPLNTKFGSPWAVLYHVPGVSAVRAIDRMQIVTGLVATLALVAAVTELSQGLELRAHAFRLQAVGVAVMSLIVLEQFNHSDVTDVHRTVQDRLVASATRPPASCRSFYVVDSADKSLPFFESQIDAMLISQRLSVPTLNGYTGYNPKGWGLEDINLPAYPLYVQAWEAAHGLGPGVCRLDLGTMRWTSAPVE